MASRAPTLAKPKAKSKVTTKKIVAKSSTAPSTVALKPVVKASTKVAAKAPAKSKTTPVKAASPKLSTVKTAVKAAGDTKVVAKHDAHKSPAKPKLLATESTAKVSGTASFEATPAAPKPRRRKGEIRTRIYWAVFNQALRRVAVFEFDQREEAEKRAAKLAQATGEHHFLQKIKALVQ